MRLAELLAPIASVKVAVSACPEACRSASCRGGTLWLLCQRGFYSSEVLSFSLKLTWCSAMLYFLNLKFFFFSPPLYSPIIPRSLRLFLPLTPSHFPKFIAHQWCILYFLIYFSLFPLEQQWSGRLKRGGIESLAGTFEKKCVCM